MTDEADNSKKAVQDSLNKLEAILNSLSNDIVKGIPQQGNWADATHYVRQQIHGIRRIVKGTLAETDKDAVKELLGVKVGNDGTVSSSRFEGFLAKLCEDISNTNQPDSAKIAKELSGIGDVLRENIETVCVSAGTKQGGDGLQQMAVALYYGDPGR